MNAEFVLSRAQRDDILQAVKAIERQLKEIAGTSHWRAVYVVGTNLSVIQASLTNLPLARSE